MTTKNLITLLLVALTLVNKAQMNIGSNTAPNADAMLEISGSSKGLLLPRITLSSTSSASPLSAHVAGMSVYNTATAGAGATAVTPGYYYNTGSAWVRLASGNGNSWLTGGNLNGAISNIGTNDNYDFPFITNGTEKMRLSTLGNLGIGITSPASKLDVAALTTTVNTVINATGTINDYLQFNVQNNSTGSQAQSGYSSTADNGSATSGFAWVGINNSNFNFPTTYNIGGGNDVSFLGSGQDLHVANANNTKSIIFSTGKSTTPYFNERMRITNVGYVGIGTSTPASKLDVAAGTTTVNTVINATGTINDYLQFNVQNNSTGSQAQSGYSSTADNGSATSGFAWVGINNSNFNYPTTYNIGGANDVSFLGSGQDLYVANANNTKSIIFSTGKSTTPYFNERMRITNAGYVGIGTNNPLSQLHIVGSVTTPALTNRGGLASLQASNGAMEIFASTASPYGFGFQVRDYTSNTSIPLILEPAGGYVGIGTFSPAYPLDVQTTLSTSISGYGYLNASGTTGYIAGSSGVIPYSARFSGRVICPEFDAQSDLRIKNIKSISNSANDLATLNQIKITNYEMKDSILWRNKPFKKVIAQELEQVYSQAVSLSIGFIPNIYQQANTIEKVNGDYKLNFKKSLSINNDAKKIRVITNAGNFDMDVVTMPDNKTLLLKGENLNLKEGENIFIYGEEVNDFRVVDYEALGTLNISATQELSKQMEALKKENAALKIQVEQMHRDNCALKEDNNERIGKLEASLKLLSVSLIGSK